MVLFGSVSLATKGLESTRHAQQETESDGDDDGGGNGNGGEVEVAEVASEGLSYDGHGEQSQPAENGGSSNCPHLLRLQPCLFNHTS